MSFKNDKDNSADAQLAETPSEDKINWETNLEFILNVISNLRSCRAYKIFPQPGDPRSGLRRAAVAIVLRFNFNQGLIDKDSPDYDSSKDNFDDLHTANLEAMGFSSYKSRKDPDWRLTGLFQDVRRYHPNLEVLFMQRVIRDSDRWSGHVSFPGGKRDLPQDLTDFDTATRECFEEIGLNLKSAENFFFLGELDDRLVKTRFGQKDLLILSPQVFVQVSKTTPDLNLDNGEVAKADWVSLNHILNFMNKPSTKKGAKLTQNSMLKHWHSIDIAKYIFPAKKSSSLRFFGDSIRFILRFLIGSMHFNALPMPTPFKPTLLWGLTLGMVSDLVDLGHTPREVARLVPLEYPLPAFDIWPINAVVNWFCQPDYLRKPVTSRSSSPWENYFYVIKAAGISTLLTRVILVFSFIRYLYFRRNFAFNLLLGTVSKKKY